MATKSSRKTVSRAQCQTFLEKMQRRKGTIQRLYCASVANMIYTFPRCSYDSHSTSSLSELTAPQYDLKAQNRKQRNDQTWMQPATVHHHSSVEHGPSPMRRLKRKKSKRKSKNCSVSSLMVTMRETRPPSHRH